ncbi:phosphoribosyl 1,2-cyclic phosphate phosphodiesterase [Saccharicrinis carchari]|uniref:Phosphoribosyl 1,2-cyclic phosphate phosphodiesterase n=1 Tax=Saccharicrinis carchari TaxID=1168039 RepID=A0A521E2F4_SACCC|nr:MBL fold metallo-hydrolase [Saccharicrinis carchari]SMO77491.1 phosphoribosyl 1,2-cyclic phosphate phosphodiesterase [Saccharicrinis carchari]
MKVTFLGTGTSQGVPVIACQCDVCKSTDSHDRRLRSSVLIEVGGLKIVIDPGPDFRQQMLLHDVRSLDAILLTHEHKDHIAGLDDVRAFNWMTKKPVDVFAEQRVLQAVKNEFAYAFVERPYPGVPKINLKLIDEQAFKINGIEIIPIRGMHMKLPVLGFRIGSFSYLTDFNYIPNASLNKVRGSQVMVINGVRKEPHVSHFSLSEAVEVLQKVNPPRGYITHISHQLGRYAIENPLLPPNIQLAYDGLVVECE